MANFCENRLRDVEHLVDGKKTRLLAINVSIPSLTVARLEHFSSPQMTDNKPSFTRKPHVVIFRQSSFAANAVPKLVAMASSLRPSISAMSSLDSLTPKTYPLESNSESLDAIQPKLCGFKVYLPHPHTKGTAALRGGWAAPSMFGMDVLT